MELIRQHSTVQSLAVHGTEVARYQSGTGLAKEQSPRPFLHPVRTLHGTMVSDAEPPDHRHHLGLSLAVSDLGGTNYWGGSTYVAGSGPAMLPNHGRQVVVSSRSSAEHHHGDHPLVRAGWNRGRRGNPQPQGVGTSRPALLVAVR